jgi:alkanesulfonate monooxygenase SsuD/methylene tetrahydromethanopterin reductase-like flavin-dependent oxidoreductase (luciferase family)
MKVGIFDWVEAHPSLSPAQVYEHKLALAAAADQAGLHGMYFAEHQGTPLSIDGSPALLLAALFQRTKRLRAGALTFCLPWYDPFRFYNEVCMLDQMSGGRLELGVGRGVSPIESQIFGLKGIDESRAKYRETLDLFFEAARTKVLRYRNLDVEIHVKPAQEPYPPLWFPSSNKDGIDFTAQHGYHTAFLGRTADCKPLFERYREAWARHRNDPGRHNAHVTSPHLARTQHLVIAEDAAEAKRLGEAAHQAWNGHIHHLTRKMGRPPVHNTEAYSKDSAHPLMTGAPRQVAEQLQEMIEATGINYLLCVFSFGDLAPQHAERSLELFAREVMPAL